MLLCSHSPNDVPPEPQRNVSIAAVRGAVCPSKRPMIISICTYILDESILKLRCAWFSSLFLKTNTNLNYSSVVLEKL